MFVCYGTSVLFLALVLANDRKDGPSKEYLINELKGIQKELADIKEMKKEVKVLSDRLNDAFRIIHQQQLFLEYVDNSVILL